MNQPQWLDRPTAAGIETPGVGDRATLHFDQTYQYMVTAEVTTVAQAALTGTVIAIFDRATQAQVRDGEVLSLVGSPVTFLERQIVAVARKPVP